jgi:glycosyltransferase involved in cell wall biosynthesis
MNILICNQWFPPSSIGGVAQYNEYLTKGLSKKGHNVVVLSSLGKDFLDYKVTNGIRIYRLKMPNVPVGFNRVPVIGSQHRFIRNLLYSNSVCQFLKQLIPKYQIDLIEYADINGEGFFHRKCLGNLPYVARCHTPYYLLEQTYEPGEMPFSCRLINWMEKRTIKRADGITAPSQDLAGRIEKWCGLEPGKVIPIPNLIDTDWFHPDPDYAPGDVVKILFVGRVEKAKGIFVLADAIPRVVDQYKKVKFIFVGEPRSQKGFEDFKDYLKQLGIDHCCEFTGPVTREKLRELYQRCDIFVNPSYIYESFSYTNAEAMACGKPVVTSDIGGMPETVGDMIGGLVFRNKDSEDLADKLKVPVADYALRMMFGKQARKRAENFSVGTITDGIVGLYHNCLENRSFRHKKGGL